MSDAAKPMALNPWAPMTDPLDIAHLGKLGEELSEGGSAASRCLIQGIDECEPVTGKPNREWLEDELADIAANAGLVIERYGLNIDRMEARIETKRAHLRGWHAMIARGEADPTRAPPEPPHLGPAKNLGASS